MTIILKDQRGPEVGRVGFRVPTKQPRNLGAAAVWIAVSVSLRRMFHRATAGGLGLTGSRVM